MLLKTITASVAGAAIAVAAPALADPPPGAGAGAGAGANVNAGAMGGPSGAAIDARVNSQGSVNASPQGVLNSNVNSALHTTTTTPPGTSATTNSQGLQHASPTGIAHANSNSVLARGAVAATALPGLTTGLTVQNSSGTTIGTISRIVTGANGSIRLVIVTTATGQTLRLAPSTLSISGGVVTTTTAGL
jgi:hypothetical protein